MAMQKGLKHNNKKIVGSKPHMSKTMKAAMPKGKGRGKSTKLTGNKRQSR